MASSAATTATEMVALRRVPVFAWAMYDFANTIFSFAVISRYFNPWMINTRHVADWKVSLTGLVVALLLVATLAPFGAIADAYGRRMPFLVAFTLLCVAATALLGVLHTGVLWSLIMVGIANYCYQSALAHYDPLLAEVAPPERQGRVSGLGVGVGYVGSIVANFALLAIVTKHHEQDAFLPTAAMFLVFALPCFLLVRERTMRTPLDESVAAISRRALAELRSTARNIHQYGSLGRFLLARFLYADAILTVIVYMTVYLSRLGGFDERDKSMLIAFSTLFAIAGAFTAGFFVERVGPKPVIVTILCVFAPGLALTGLIGTGWLMWVAGPVTGATLGAIWTSDRVLMMRLTPADERGEFFGIYNLIGKLSSGLGPLVLWSGTIWVLHSRLGWSTLDGSRAALVMLALATAIGASVIAKVTVPDPA